MSTARSIASACSLVFCLTAVQCKAVRQAISDRLAPAASSAAPAQPLGRVATEPEAVLFAQQLEQAVKSGRDLSGVIDGDAIVARGFADLDLPAAQGKSAAEAMARKFGEALQLGIKGGGSYKLLANRVIDGERRVKFRLLQAAGAFNYHDYVVVVRGGTAKAVDIHVLTTGEAVSKTLRRSVLPVAVEMKKGLLTRLTTQESTYVKNLPTIMKMSEFQTNPKAVLAAYASLPDALKTDKNVLTFRMHAASMVDDAAYLSAMEDFRRAFPNDDAQRVMSIDYFYMKKMFKEALEQVTALEKAAGPDAHLNTLRASVNYELGSIEAARNELRAALELEPDLAEAVNLAIALDLASRDEPAALAKIKEARRLNVDLSTVEQNPAYVAFMARPATKKKLEAPAPK